MGGEVRGWVANDLALGFVYTWTVRMGGTGLRMFSRVSVGGAGHGLRTL